MSKPICVIAHLLLLTQMKFILSAFAFVQPRPRSRYYSCSYSCSTTSSSSPLSLAMSLHPVDTVHPYHPPAWTDGLLKNAPKHRLHIANLPTPIHRIGGRTTRKLEDKSTNYCCDDGGILSRLHELNINLYMKRDDATGGVELGGNKIRKLEFLLADALEKKCDSVVTIGGEQSNHCRATAAARLVSCWTEWNFRFCVASCA
jgi:hypothetical protein